MGHPEMEHDLVFMGRMSNNKYYYKYCYYYYNFQPRFIRISSSITARAEKKWLAYGGAEGVAFLKSSDSLVDKMCFDIPIESASPIKLDPQYWSLVVTYNFTNEIHDWKGVMITKSHFRWCSSCHWNGVRYSVHMGRTIWASSLVGVSVPNY